MSEPILEVRHLKKYFKTKKGTLHAVDDVSLKIDKGTTMGVVGESGCGKSTFGRTILHLGDPTDGNILFEGKDVTRPSGSELRNFRNDVQMIFQDPYASLNPRMTIHDILQEPLIISGKYTKGELEKETDNLMELVGIDRRLIRAYPHELDGGRRQRVGIGRALACHPKLIICDEPVSALDVSIQAQILNLLQDLQEQMSLTYFFITHNLSVVKHISDHICVMYLGQVVETTTSKQLFEKPVHPYTQALLSAIPTVDLDNMQEQIVLKGEITSPIDPAPGCRFAARCPYATEKCRQPQELREIEKEHFVACCRAGEL